MNNTVQNYRSGQRNPDRRTPELPKPIPFKSWTRRTAADILATDYPSIQWVVPEIIPEGLTKIDGGPKVGKSWLALHLATAVSSGGYFMGSIKVDQREVLYLALEDGERRLKNRLLKQGGIGNDQFFIETATTWKGGISTLTAYLKEYPSTGVVIVDTLFMFSPIQDTNKYSDTYTAISAIQRIATEKDIPIVLIHHTRKGAKGDIGEGWADEGMGSQGINGACDTIILLKKPDGKDEGTMRIKGRDVEERCINVVFDRDICTWRITGEGEIVKTDTQARAEIISLLEKAGPEGMRLNDISVTLSKGNTAISNVLKTLQNMGRIKKVAYGKYSLSQFHVDSEMNANESVNAEKLEDSQLHSSLGKSEAVNLEKQQEIW